MSSRAPLQRWDNFTRQIQCSSHQLGFCCRLAKQKPFLTKRHVAACEEFAKRHLDVFLTMQSKLLWSNDRMIKLLAEIPSGVCIGNQALSVPSLIPSLQPNMMGEHHTVGMLYFNKDLGVQRHLKVAPPSNLVGNFPK